MFVVALADVLGLDLDKVKETIKNFKPLEYRLENIGIIDGIEYYVDTIATVPEATMEAIKAISNINTLIIGGEDRSTEYDHFINFLNNDPAAKNDRNIFYTDKLKEAYEIAKKYTDLNKTCLFSPAASSKDYFKDYREKGQYFKCLVNNQETDIKEHK